MTHIVNMVLTTCSRMVGLPVKNNSVLLPQRKKPTPERVGSAPSKTLWCHKELKIWSAVRLDLLLAVLFVITEFSVTLFIFFTFYSSGHNDMFGCVTFHGALAACWDLLWMESIKEETSELKIIQFFSFFFSSSFKIQSRTNSTASLTNTEYILSSSSLLQHNLNFHLLDTIFHLK